MKRSLQAVAIVLIVFSSVMVLAQESTAGKSNPETLAPVAWLVGGTWVCDVKDPASGASTHIENRIRWAPNHQAINFDTNFNGKPHYNGFYAYNPAAQKVSFYYTSSEGELIIGTADPDADGKTLHQDFDISHADGKTGHLRSTLVRDGSDAYWFTVFMQKDGDWGEVLKIRYQRKAD